MWIFKSHRTAMSQTTPAAPHAQPPQHTALAQALQRPYQYGFVTDIEADSLPPGLDEDTIRAISRKKREPDFRLQWRLAAFCALARHGAAALGALAHRPHRPASAVVLRRNQADAKRAQEPR